MLSSIAFHHPHLTNARNSSYCVNCIHEDALALLRLRRRHLRRSEVPVNTETTNIRCVRKKEREIVIATDSRRQLVILSGCSTKAPANNLPEGPIARSQKRSENREGRIETIATTDRENIAPANWTAVAMWFCCLLGVACVLFGIDGIYTSFSQEASSGRFEWLGFGYVPLLRGTAVASVVLGGMLVRRGWSNP